MNACQVTFADHENVSVCTIDGLCDELPRGTYAVKLEERNAPIDGFPRKLTVGLRTWDIVSIRHMTMTVSGDMHTTRYRYGLSVLTAAGVKHRNQTTPHLRHLEG